MAALRSIAHVPLVALLTALPGCERSVAPPSNQGPTKQTASEPAAPLPADLARYEPAVQERIRTAASKVDAAPRDMERWRDFGMLYQAYAALDLAERCYRTAVALPPEDAAAWYYLAVVQHRLGRVEAALASIRRSIELEPTFIATRWRAVEWLLKEGDLDAAEHTLRPGRDRAPHDPRGRLLEARLCLQRRQPEPAVRLLEQLVRDQPDRAYLHFLLGTALRATGDRERAAAELALGDAAPTPWTDEWLTRVTNLYTGFESDLTRFRKLLEQGRVRPAVTLLEQRRVEHPDDLRLLRELSRGYRMLDDLEAALATLLHAQEVDPNDGDLQMRLAGTYRARAEDAVDDPAARARDLETAERHGRRAVERAPRLPEAHAILAEILLMQGDTEGAVTGYLHATKLKPVSADFQFRLGFVLCMAKRWAEAAPPLLEAHRLDETNGEAVFLLAAALANAGAVTQAQEVLEQAVDLYPDDGRFQEMLDQIRAQLGG